MKRANNLFDKQWVYYLLFWAVFLLAVDGRCQVFTIWNETGENIWSIGMWSQGSGFMSGDWGSPSIANGAGPITVQSSYFQSISCTPVCSANNACVSYVNGVGPWPTQTWGGGSNAQYYIVYVQQNTTPSTPHVYTYVPPQYTNSGCITLNNNTANSQYYQFVSTGGSGTQKFHRVRCGHQGQWNSRFERLWRRQRMAGCLSGRIVAGVLFHH